MRGDLLSLAVISVVAVGVTAAPAHAGKGVDGVVNLNTAPAAVLALLPGVGPAKADAIVGYRTRRPFRTVDELVRIKGIGRKMVRRLRPHLAVAGPTTAAVATVAVPAAGGTSSVPPPPARPPPPPVRCPLLAAGPPRRPRGER
ncbi:MAG TPA: helix-hairpin-helix domain-containing protein, partial [Polyangia bacterium]|nr:helix-hairpin-helix domain-containing protein [Polyangia bacterium]